MRVLLSKDGHITVTLKTLPSALRSDPTNLSLFKPPSKDDDHFESAVKVYIDQDSTTPTVFTSTKTTFREAYDEATSRNAAALASIAPFYTADVLLHNQDGQLMEGTIYNIAVHRDGKWITPSTKTGCLPGVMRRWLLENGRIHEDTECTLTIESIELGEWILLFNGVRGCRLGKIFMARS